MPTTLFLVDDDPLILHSLGTVLQSVLQVRVRRFDSPAPALVELDQVRPDLIVTDLVMPGMSGLCFLKAVHQRMPNIPAILITGHLNDHAAEVVRNLDEIKAVLEKPFPMDRFIEKVAAALPTPIYSTVD